MFRNVMHVFCAIALSILGLSGAAQAASLGKVDVASHLGEPFYAEVPLGLDEGETISSIFVELASNADYQILEVFRDSVVGSIRADVKSDSRGNRVELTSTAAIDSPFINLVLKVRYGRATHFKKFSIFLDLPRAAKPMAEAKALPVQKTGVADVKTEVELAPADEAVAETDADSTAFNAYDGWARTDRYGPMVYGDTISTVAERLRVDERYTRQQVMVALFEKNKDKFSEENINLIDAGTYLDVPSAQDVEHVSHAQALSLLQKHNAKWKELTQQDKYAKVAEAQKTRYSKHVRVGDVADGVASQPLVQDDQSNDDTAKTIEKPVAVETSEDVSSAKTASDAAEKNTAAMQTLLQENTDLQQRLQDMEAKMAALAAQPSSAEGLAASNARIEKLELQLARQAGELEKARKQAAMQQGEGSQGMGLLTWILMGVVGLLSIIAGYLAYALRGQRSLPVNEADMAAHEPELTDVGFDDAQSEVEEVDVEELDVEEVHVEEVANDPMNFEETVLGSSDDFEAALAEAIPELTDEDTSEMEAFTEAEESPDPNVDYLTEADVYMRYGMEDEAEKQVKMALRLREDNKDAHVKLIQIRHARSDQAGVEEASATARAVLTGDALSAFAEELDALGKDASSEDASLDDTMPPTSLEMPVDEVSSEEGDSSFEVADLELPDFGNDDSADSEGDVLDLGDIDSSSDDIAGDEEGADSLLEGLTAEDTNVVDTPLLDEAEDVSDLLNIEEEADEPVVEEGLAEADEDSSLEGLTAEDTNIVDTPSLNEAEDISDLLNIEEEIEPVKEELVEEDLVEEVAVADDVNEVDLDLSDLDISDLGDEKDMPVMDEENSVASSFEAADLDSTVVMDWSKDTSVITDGEDIGGESGAEHKALEEPVVDLNNVDSLDGLDMSPLENLDEKEVGIEVEEEPSEASDDKASSGFNDELSSISFNLDNIDIDMDAVADDSTEADDFTSTIQSTLIDLGVEESDLDVSLEPVDDSTSDDDKDSFDADLELDNLLSDLDMPSDDEKDKT